MKRSLLVLALLLAPSLAEKEAPGTDALSFLAGTWKGAMGGGEFVAYYAPPAEGKVLSFSEMRAGGRVGFYEFEVFEAKAKTIVFTPYPGGRRRASFQLSELTPKKAVFDNPKKDFPTRISYHRVADDNLVITLTDPHGKSGKVQKFDLKRVK